MKLFLDTADVTQIKVWSHTGLIDGVTTNPTHLSKSGGSPINTILEICSLLPAGEISVEVTEKDPEVVYKQAKALAALAKNVVVKIPCHRDYYAVIGRLAREGIKLNITLIFSVIQGLAMCKLGVAYISPFIGRWDGIDVEGSMLLYQMRTMLDNFDYTTCLIAASLRHVRHLHEAIMAGSDAATIPVAVLEQATEHILTDRGIEAFDDDWKKLGVQKFP